MKKHFFSFATCAVLLAGLAIAATASGAPSESYWHDDASRALSSEAPHPAEYRALTLDTAGVAAYLQAARKSGMATEIALPQPEGGFAEFNVVDSGTMPIELQKKYPDIISLKGGDAKGRALRLDVSPMGFQAMVFDPAGIWIVRPEVLGSGNRYLSFKRAELAVPTGEGTCEVRSSIDPAGLNLTPAPMTQTGVNHRIYRAAVAANHQYIAAVGGGTVAGGLAATVVAVNRVTQVYESEMSIQLTLVPNDDLIMYASATGDPFTGNGSGVINNSTSVISAAIGAGNYDIGHVFTTGSGGVAGLGVVCGSSSKGRGTTGLPNPTGDAFYIDYVAHEMGHQFGGNHPFNGTQTNCSGGNRNGATAYEPGSGSTIMAYAGICAGDDLQPHSDPFFHAISLQEITNYTNGSGNCSVNALNSNHAPVIDTASLPTGLTIPARTPFSLSGSATDVDSGDVLSYSWEEWDLGAANPLTGGDIGSGPIIRAFAPTASGERMFPRPSTILGGAAAPGEILPTTTRALKFRLTVRDNRAGAGTSQSADIALNVVNTAGPFKVTAPNTAVSWAQGSLQTVTWDVANTAASPVSCSTVDIALSSDGGQTYPNILATGVANSGSAGITVPSVATTQARVSVSCANNIFFDVSDVNFTIPAGAGTFTVGGNVSGLAGSGLVLQLNGANNLSVAANGAFTFPSALANGVSYAVTVGTQPATPAQTCTVTNGSGTIASANVTNVVVACTTPPPPTYTVGGAVSGLSGSGLALSLNGGTALPIGANGVFTFPTALSTGAVYTVTVSAQPTSPAQLCTVANGSGTIANANVTNVAVACTTSYTVAGSVGGLAGSGLALKLNGGGNFAIAANGAFTFPVAVSDGATYSVTVATQPSTPAQTCTVANGSGTIAGANVTNVAVTCTTNTYTVGGNVTGLAGTGLVLQLNGANNLAVSTGGAFVFATGVASGATYAVTVGAQPGSPAQTCTVTNGAGTIAAANVANVAVTCTTVNTDVIFADGFESAGPAPQPVQDPSFEATTGEAGSNPSWSGSDDNAGAGAGDTPFYSASASGVAGHTGNWEIWFGGWAGGPETQTASQSVTIPTGAPRFLNYWRFFDLVPDATGTLTVSIDGNVVETTNLSTSTVDAEYVLRSIDISAYANGAVHTVLFRYQYTDTGATNGDGEVFIDDVTIDPTATPIVTRPASAPRVSAQRHTHR